MRSRLRCQSRRPASVYAPISRFSMTVMEAKTCRPSGTCAIPRCGRRDDVTDSKSCPSKVMEPAMAWTEPEIVLNRVLLPAPLGPTIATNSPSLTVMFTSLRTGTAEYPATSCLISSIFSAPLFSQIGLNHPLVLRDGLRFANDQHSPVVQYHELVDQTHHGLHGVLDNDDSDACCGERTY